MIPKFLHNKAEFHQEWRRRVGEDRLLSIEGTAYPLSVAWSTVEQALKILSTLWNIDPKKYDRRKKRRAKQKAKLVKRKAARVRRAVLKNRRRR